VEIEVITKTPTDETDNKGRIVYEETTSTVLARILENVGTKPDSGICSGILCDGSLGGWVDKTQFAGYSEPSTDLYGIYTNAFYEWVGYANIFGYINYGCKATGAITLSQLINPVFRASVTNPIASGSGKFEILGSGIDKLFSNKGTATVANGQTYVTVTHGLAFTPTADQIRVTPTNNMGNAAKYWISNLGATSFRINVNADPGATTATFSWKTEY
jgi:hypothetical protein